MLNLSYKSSSQCDGLFLCKITFANGHEGFVNVQIKKEKFYCELKSFDSKVKLFDEFNSFEKQNQLIFQNSIYSKQANMCKACFIYLAIF